MISMTEQRRHTCRKILALLDMSEGFEVLFVECDSPGLQQELEEALAEEGREFHWHRIRLEEEVVNLSEDLLARRLPLDEQSVISLRGLNLSIQDAHNAADVVARLNLARDLLPKYFPCPVLFWLPRYAVQQFARFAPDLWSWRAGLFYFEPEPQAERPLQTQPLPQETDNNLEQYSQEFRESEIEFLRSQIEEFKPETASQRELKEHSDTLLRLAKQYRETHRFLEALEAVRQAEEFCRQQNDQAALASCYNEKGRIYQASADLQNAIASFEHALTIGKEALGDRDAAVADYLNNLGSAWDDLGEHHKAIEYYEQALAIDREVFGDRHPNVAIRLNNLGSAWNDLGEHHNAIEYYKQALAIDREVFGDRHPNVARELNNLGTAWKVLGELHKAIEYFKQALAIDREVFGDRHPNVAILLNNLGSAWKVLGELRKAIEYYEQALAINREVFGDRHPNVATALNNLGAALKNIGDTRKALEHYQQALEIFTQVYGSEHPSTRTVQENLDLLLEELQG